MSRSVRKQPISPNTTCRSEKVDKQIWHKSWRRRERVALARRHPLETFEDHLSAKKEEVVNVWDMGKDGRKYTSIDYQRAILEGYADDIGRSSQERAALSKRLQHQWMGK
jgi:hypothetical protein